MNSSELKRATFMFFSLSALIFSSFVANAGESVPSDSTGEAKKGGETVVVEAKPAGPAPVATDPKPRFVRVRLLAEFGMLAPVQNTLQKGKNGTKFNYITEGGEDSIFPAGRVSAELNLAQAHTIILLYQPLDLKTDTVLSRDVLVDNVLFVKGTPMNLRYGFDFWRLSYLYNFMYKKPRNEVSLGASLQIRNASIEFSSADGGLRSASNNIGPVPAIKRRLRHEPIKNFWYGGEFDFMYAPIKYINGSNSDVVGALADLNLRVGYRVWRPLDIFLNFRYLGGGASGTGSSGYTDNWVSFLMVTIGVEFDVTELM